MSDALYDAVVVGGGAAGLTATAYLARAGYDVLLCEKQDICGGLVNSFWRDGFFYDGGIRALEDSGVLFPMLEQLGLDIEFVKNRVSLGIEDKHILLDSEESVTDYQNMLCELYEDSADAIERITAQIRQIMTYMEVLYGIKNPVFLDLRTDRQYLVKKILPWMVRYALTFRKIAALDEPVVDFLRKFTDNEALLDVITQHFFKETPAFFALSYVKLYLDYYYPLGGTGKFVEQLLALIGKHGGEVRTNAEIVMLDPVERLVVDSQGNRSRYRQLIWAANQTSLYRLIDIEKFQDDRVRQAVAERRELIAGKKGNDSVYTLFAAVDLPPSYFSEKMSAHHFYTPSRQGESIAGPPPVGQDRVVVEEWLSAFFALTTYEMSCPVMRDASLAPEGKTGLIISVLFDYSLTKYVLEAGWYDAFKSYCDACILRTLDNTIFPGIQAAVIHQFSATPWTMESRTGNHEGAITGWSFTNQPLPAESRIPRIQAAIRTPIPGIAQAGQWTYSPSGLPVSLLTGKLAADKTAKAIGRPGRSTR